jgi:hypothetical protein
MPMHLKAIGNWYATTMICSMRWDGSTVQRVHFVNTENYILRITPLEDVISESLG